MSVEQVEREKKSRKRSQSTRNSVIMLNDSPRQLSVIHRNILAHRKTHKADKKKANRHANLAEVSRLIEPSAFSYLEP